jgi:predicted amidophosphoribosyltransferase
MHAYCSECGGWIPPDEVDEFITHPVCDLCLNTMVQNHSGWDSGDASESMGDNAGRCMDCGGAFDVPGTSCPRCGGELVDI